MTETQDIGVRRFPISRAGYLKMKAELESFVSHDRPEIIAAISEARAHGDLSENAEYHAAKEKQGMIEAKIADLSAKLSRAEIIEISDVDHDKVQFGATVRLEDAGSGKEVVYSIVSDYEADLRSGNISIYSPVAKALLGKKIGDEVEVETPRGLKYYEVLAIEYGGGSGVGG